jgi:uncharacterized metal-binding protein YceD (DUF177 family)
MSAPEFSRFVRLDTLGDGPRTVEIEANAAEREALCERFGLVELNRLVATAEVTRAGDVVEAKGRLSADLVQACVATAADVPATIDEAFALRFAPERPLVGGEQEIELEEKDLDEMSYSGGAIDLGEAVAQTLVLSIDLFPRAPDADDHLRAVGVIPEEEAKPFSALQGLRDLLKK